MKPCVPDNLPVELNLKNIIEPVGKANRAIANYNGTLQGIINPNVLLSPITVQEAVLSSKIEGTQATLVEVLEHEAGNKFEDHKSSDIKEIINYRHALLIAEQSVCERPLSMSLMKELHAILMDSVRGEDKNPGEFRKEQNWIGKRGCSIEEARFVPPSVVVMISALENLEQFIASNFYDPLIQLAIVHAQFEIIHPFNDGNGRIGRMIIPLFLFQKNVLQKPVFYLSEYLERNDTDYRDGLLSITENNNWEQWIIFFLNAIEIQAKKNSEKAQKIHTLFEKMKEEFPRITNSKYSLSALDTLFSKPIINSTDFFKLSSIPTKLTATNILKALQEEGILKLTRQGKGQTPSTYAFKELINIAEGRKVLN